MTGQIYQSWDPDEGDENVLKPFLVENLPSRFVVGEGESIVDALVIVRIVDMHSEGGLPERYEYTTSLGLSFAMGRGMIQCTHEQMTSLYQQVIDVDDED